MSDCLDIRSQCSEIEEDAVNALKEASKVRRGRGFVRSSGGEIQNIKVFDRLENTAREIASKIHQVQPQGSIEGWVLFVTGIHEEATEEDVKEMFNEHGIIKNLMLNLDRRTGYIKGHALVEYEKFPEALSTKENLNGAQLLGRTIKVDWCFTKGPNLVNYAYYARRNSVRLTKTHK